MFDKTKDQVKSIYKTTKKDLECKYNNENIHMIYGTAKSLLTEKLEKDIRGRLEDLKPCDLLDIVRMAESDDKHCYDLVKEIKVEPKEDRPIKRTRRGRKTKRVKKQE